MDIYGSIHCGKYLQVVTMAAIFGLGTAAMASTLYAALRHSPAPGRRVVAAKPNATPLEQVPSAPPSAAQKADAAPDGILQLPEQLIVVTIPASRRMAVHVRLPRLETLHVAPAPDAETPTRAESPRAVAAYPSDPIMYDRALLTRP
jgi:hypothetical protein